MWSQQVIWSLFLGALVPTCQACFEYSSTIPNPCLEKECPFGAECVSSFNGRNAECVCPAKCPSFGDSRESRVICGSDGRDYPNLCELNRYACSLAQTVSVRYNGSCGKHRRIVDDSYSQSKLHYSKYLLLRSVLWSQVPRLANLSD